MIVCTIEQLIKSLKKYPKSAKKEVVGLMWYRRKFFKYDVQRKNFLTNELFEEALDNVDEERADEYVSGQIIDYLQNKEMEEEEEEMEDELEEEELT